MTTRLALALAALGSTVVAGSALAAPIDKFITVRPIVVCNDAGANCPSFNLREAEVNKIFAQAGLGVIYEDANQGTAGIQPFQFNETDFQTTQISFFGSDGLDEWRGLLRGAQSDPIRSPNPTTLNVFFVNTLLNPDGASAGGIAFVNGNGVIVSQGARIDTLAHEIAHNLGLDHNTFGVASTSDANQCGTLSAADRNNLMQAGTCRNVPASTADIAPDGQNRDRLNAAQIAQARAPLFSVNMARAVGEVTVGSTISRTIVRFEDSLTTETIDKIRVLFPAGSIVADFTDSTPDNLIQNGCPAQSAMTSSSSLLSDGTVQIEYTFGEDCFFPSTGVSLRYAQDVGGNIVPIVPFSMTFQFDSGASSQAGLDEIALANTPADDPFIGFDTRERARFSFVGTPSYGLNVQLPEPGIPEPHIDPIPEPGTLTLLLAGAGGLLALRRRRIS